MILLKHGSPANDWVVRNTIRGCGTHDYEALAILDNIYQCFPTLAVYQDLWRLMEYVLEERDDYDRKTLVLGWILKHVNDENITSSFIQALILNKNLCAFKDLGVIQIFLESNKKLAVSEELLSFVAKHTEHVDTIAALDALGNDIVIHDRLLEAAAMNTKCAIRLLDYLPEKTGTTMKVSTSLLMTALGNNAQNSELVRNLLTKHGELVVTEDLILKAAVNPNTTPSGFVPVLNHARLT